MEESKNTAELLRFAFTPMGVFGKLTVGDFTCVTVERPWLNNTPMVSCFPDGDYPLTFRHSNTVTRITKSRHVATYEILAGQGRTYLLFHPANTMDDLQGCVGVGDRFGFVSGKWAVLNSQDTFDKLIAAFGSKEGGWQLKVNSHTGAKL